jgi:hypothetical protein
MTVTVTIFSWLLLCPVWNAFLTKTALGRFINAHISHTLNLLVAHILFWAIAVPQVATNGVSYVVSYKQSLELNANAANGRIQTGRFGSGAFPMVFIVTVIATILWFKHMWEWNHPEVEEEEDNKDEGSTTA